MMQKSQELKPHQELAVHRIKNSILLKNNTFTNAYIASGAGLGRVSIEILLWLFDRYENLIVVTDKKILLQQLNKEFRQFLNIEETDRKNQFDSNQEIKINDSSVKFTTVQKLLSDNISMDYQKNVNCILLYDMPANSQVKLVNSYLNDENNIKVISLSGYEIRSTEWRKIFGDPAFVYSYEDAIQDGILKPVKFFPITDQPIQYFYDSEQIKNFLDVLVDEVNLNYSDKLLIVCKNTLEAEQIHRYFKSTNYESYLLVSQRKRLNYDFSRFINNTNSCIGIVVNILTGFKVPELKNIVLLSSITSELKFNNIISLISHNNYSNDLGTIWDFGGNKKLIKNEYVVIDEYDNYGRFGFLDEFDNLSYERNTLSKSNSEFDDNIKDSQGFNETEESASTRFLANPHHDKPSKVDLLGRDGLVHILKGIINRNSNKHMIISLFGRWGSGKSSVIEILEQKFDDETTHFIVFNAWLNSHTENMVASIATKITTSIYSTKGSLAKNFLSFKWHLKNKKTDFKLYFLVLILLVITFFAYSVLTGATFPKGISLGVVLTAVLAPFIKLMFNAYSKSLLMKFNKITKKPSYKTHIGVSETIKNEIKNLLIIHAKSKKSLKYIVVIDDLDRCSDQKIIDTLEAVQLVVDIENVIVIVAIDEEVLMQAVANSYKRQRTDIDDNKAFSLARDFLGKILQVTITLDKPNMTKRKFFIKERLYPDVLKNEESSDLSNLNTLKTSSQSGLIKHESENLFDYELDFDEDDSYDISEKYLSDSVDEYEFFENCVEIFNIDNPRTMIRLHNIITICKGLYPNITSTKEKLRIYMFISFWYEKYSSSIGEEKTKLYELINSFELDQNDSISVFANRIGVFNNAKYDIKKIISRVKNLSLPRNDLENFDAGDMKGN